MLDGEVWNVEKDGWTLKWQPCFEWYGGDNEYFYLYIGNKGKKKLFYKLQTIIKFKMVEQNSMLWHKRLKCLQEKRRIYKPCEAKKVMEISKLSNTSRKLNLD